MTWPWKNLSAYYEVLRLECYYLHMTSYSKMAARPLNTDPWIRVCSVHLRQDPWIRGPLNTGFAWMCVCVCVCVLSPNQYSGVLNASKTSIPGTLCIPGSVFRGLNKNWRLAVLSPYWTVWRNFTKDPGIRVICLLRLLRRYEAPNISAKMVLW